MPNELRVLIFQAEYGWIAQCLDYDISAQGATIREMKKRFALTVLGQIALDIQNNREPLKWLGQPPEYQKMYFEDGLKVEIEPIPIAIQEEDFPKEITSDARIYA